MFSVYVNEVVTIYRDNEVRCFAEEEEEEEKDCVVSES